MARFCTSRHRPPNRRGRRTRPPHRRHRGFTETAGADYRLGPREGPAARQPVLVLGHRPHAGGHPQGAGRRPRRGAGGDRPAGPRHPPGTGRRGRRRRRGGRARRRRHGERGRQRAGRHRHGPRRPAGRLHQRVRPHASGCRTSRSSPPAILLEALEAGSIRRVGLGSVNGRYYCFHVGMGYDAALVEQVEKRSGLKRWAGHPLFMWAGVTTWTTHYDHQAPALPGEVPRRRPGRRRLLRGVLQHQPVHLRRQQGRSTSPPRPTSTTAWPW